MPPNPQVAVPDIAQAQVVPTDVGRTQVDDVPGHFRNLVLKLPTLANPRLPASIERSVVPPPTIPGQLQAGPRLPMPDTAAGVLEKATRRC